MTWNYFIIFAIISVVCWIIGAIASWKEKKTLTFVFTSLGLAVFFSYILLMWITLERPPLRTMGETRLWYSFFLPLAGIIVYSRWHYRWILSFSTLLATVFVCINLFKPEIHSKTLMPALQSPWFAPPRHRLYDGLCHARCSHGNGSISAIHQENGSNNPRARHHRQSCLCRHVICHTGHAHGCALGQGSMGTLLELGPKRNMGCHHMAVLFGLYSLSSV